MSLVSSIYHRANADPPNEIEARRRNATAFKEAWLKHGLIVIYPEDILDDWIRQAFINEAEKQYGKRRKNGGR